MNYHNIFHDNMLNGEGLRVVLFVSGCLHGCPGCQNPETHNPDTGLAFDDEAKREVFDQLGKDYIKGITLTGGDPLHPINRDEVFLLCKEIKEVFPNKDIWMYTGYDFPTLPPYVQGQLKKYVDILVDGKYVESLRDMDAQWRGSTNQKIIKLHGGKF